MHSMQSTGAPRVAPFRGAPDAASATLGRPRLGCDRAVAIRHGLAALLAIALLVTSADTSLAAPIDSDQTTAVTRTGSSGQAIADFALQFVGYPYVWAGNTPAGFDCSGFTQYVILNTIGIDIGHGTAGQTAYGAFVEWGAWQPGDLVYFADTWGAGISHTGVYIGDGQFIHAENEATGVTISSLHSDYYSAHYYGAYRIG